MSCHSSIVVNACASEQPVKKLKCAPRTPITMLTYVHVVDKDIVRITLAINIALGGKGGALSFLTGGRLYTQASMSIAGPERWLAWWAKSPLEHCGP